MTAVQTRLLSPDDIEGELERLVALIKEAVDDGAGLGFLPPLHDADAREYWLSIRPELRSGVRILIGAYVDGELGGTAQLALSQWSNGQHRAEVHKVLVDGAQRGGAIGKVLIGALQDAARRHNRSLLILNTRHGRPAVRFYKELGYREAGVIPGYSRGAAGARHDTLILYRE